MTGPDPRPCTRAGCPLHGQPHPKCSAHNRAGRPCGEKPQPDQHVCHLHGGRSPNALRKAEERQAEQRARGELLTLGVAYDQDAPDVNHGKALLDLVRWKHAEVVWLRSQVQSLSTKKLVWSKTRVKVGGEDRGTTSEATVNVWWKLLRQAEDQLERYATSAHRAGIQDAQLQLARDQAQFAAAVLQRALEGMLRALIAAGLEEGLRQAWPALVASVVPDAIRELAAAEGGDQL